MLFLDVGNGNFVQTFVSGFWLYTSPVVDRINPECWSILWEANEEQIIVNYEYGSSVLGRQYLERAMNCFNKREGL